MTIQPIPPIARIVDAYWTPNRNILKLKCSDCGKVFDHPTDRWTVRCPTCRKSWHLKGVRDRYQRENEP